MAAFFLPNLCHTLVASLQNNKGRSGLVCVAGPGLGSAWWYLDSETADTSGDTDHRAAEESQGQCNWCHHPRNSDPFLLLPHVDICCDRLNRKGKESCLMQVVWTFRKNPAKLVGECFSCVLRIRRH